MFIAYDWDGTLTNLTTALAWELALVCQAAGYQIDADTLHDHYNSLTTREKFFAIARHCQTPITSHQLARFEKVHREIRRAHASRITLKDTFDGSHDALATLQAQGHTQVVCSNASHATLARIVDKLNFQPLFKDYIYTPDLLALPSKPEPHILLHAAQSHPHERKAMIGDSTADMQAATAAGYDYRIAFINCATPERARTYTNIMRNAGATHTFSSYRELPAIIDSLESPQYAAA